MNKQYRREKFLSKNEVLVWCADNKPIFNQFNELCDDPIRYSIASIFAGWKAWRKAIEIVPEKRVVEFWVNVYPHGVGGLHYCSKEYASTSKGSKSMGTIKISKEITIIDGKVVEDE